MADETIFALSSGSLPSAIAIIRVSGPLAGEAFRRITDSDPKPRRLRYGPLLNAAGDTIDLAVAVFLPGPNSATGEDCTEFHVHGSRPVVAGLFEALHGQGCRAAEAGDFTKRAFLHGKLDLAQAEAVADLIAADTEAQRRFAAAALNGVAGNLYAGWRARLLHARAMIEAEFDFADEGDVPGSVADDVWQDMARLVQAIDMHAGRFKQAEILRDGFEVVILGAPNAGKSSLLNALAAREVAIVSEEAGTTRDLIEVQLDLGGIKVRVIDTAGLHAGSGNQVEKVGMERARLRAADADLILRLVDLSAPMSAIDLPQGVAHVTVGSKADLATEFGNFVCELRVSSKTGEGVVELTQILHRHASEAVGNQSETMPSRERHVGHLREASLHLGTAMNEMLPIELRAEELRCAGLALGRITGEIGTEEVLGAIFSRFCIGK